MLAKAQYALISNTPFVYLTHLGPLIIPDGKTAHMNSKILISHTEEVHLFRKVVGVNQYLVQQTVTTVDEEYLTDILNCITNSVNDTVDDVFTRLQDNYSQLMPHEIFENEGIFNKMMYHPRDPIANVFSTVKELLEFAEITKTS